MFCLFLKVIFPIYNKNSQTFLLTMDVTDEHIHPSCLDCESLVPGNPTLKGHRCGAVFVDVVFM